VPWLGDDVYVPEHYEAGYAYPLLLWLADSSSGSNGPLSLMAGISARNYLGFQFPVELPGAQKASTDADWVEVGERVTAIASDVYRAVGRLRRQLHVHTERVYVAGVGRYATAAMQLLLNRPEWFAGGVALGGRFPVTHSPLRRFRELPGRRLLIGIENQTPKGELASAIRSGRLLHGAGVDVSTQIYDTPLETAAQALRGIDRWIMSGIHAESLV
jgi:phospholipase/carboxylesterase